MLNLYRTPLEYVYESKKNQEKKYKQFRALFILLSLFMFMCGLFTGVITPIVISKSFFTSFPTWYFIASASATALSGLVSSLLNFYVVKDSMSKCKMNINMINKEIILYINKSTKNYQDTNRDYNLYISIGMIMNSHAAKKVGKNG